MHCIAYNIQYEFWKKQRFEVKNDKQDLKSICLLQTNKDKTFIDWLELSEHLWIIVMFLSSAIWTVILMIHPFSSVDLLVRKWCNAAFIQTCSEKETNSSTS